MFDTPLRYYRHMTQIAPSGTTSGIFTDQLPFGIPCRDEGSIWIGAQNSGTANRVKDKDLAVHRWYRFVLSFPPHLVQHYLEDFGVGVGDLVFDPFCGTGTTLVECQKRGIMSIGLEAMPMSHFASNVKTNWLVEPLEMKKFADRVHEESEYLLRNLPCPSEYRKLPANREKLLIGGSISPLPLHRLLTLAGVLDNTYRNDKFHDHARLALAKTAVADASNLRFGPEVGVGAKKLDADVVSAWLRRMEEMADDIIELENCEYGEATAFQGDARQVASMLKAESVNVVITSPPYPNEKDYSRATRLETVILGFASEIGDLRRIKKSLIRSNTRSIYKNDNDEVWVAEHPEVCRISEEIETRRLTLGKTSGFERNYAKVARNYFGGMTRHLENLKPVLRPGAKLAYVVGDQASYMQVMIRTGNILADIAETLGYKVDRLDLFRTRRATATGANLREEVLVLNWPGEKV